MMITNTLSPLPSAEMAPPPTANISGALPPLNKNVKSTTKKNSKPLNLKKSYVQTSKSNLSRIEDIVQVKEVFSTLSLYALEIFLNCC